MSFDTVLIVGCGLIGSSLARAARQFGEVKTVLISDRDAGVCKIVEGLGIADKVSKDAAALAGDADLVILCVPSGAMGEAGKAIIPAMKPGSTLTDVGSVKGAVIKALAPHMRDDISLVPGHPIAGTENSGPTAGFATLFKDRWCILTPESDDAPGVENLKIFWESLGSQVAIMPPARHDVVLAATSHVPHLLAFTLVGTAVDMEEVTKNEVVKYSAGGFRDFTRIAASDPTMWRDVFLNNQDAVLEVVDRFIEDLSALKKAIRWGDGEQLFDHFSKTRDIRRRIVDAGQDTDLPNFGRGSGEEE